MSSIRLGQKVRDIVTGYEGIAVARIEYLNKCVRFGVQPELDKDGKLPAAEYIDVEQLEVIGEGVQRKAALKRAQTGGSRPTPPERSHP